MLDYFSSGSTMGAVNIPQVQLQTHPVGARFSHVHRNVPGMLRRLNEVFLQRDINIIAQYLETDSEVGYVVLDADLAGHESHEILDDVRALDGTIRARLVYQHLEGPSQLQDEVCGRCASYDRVAAEKLK